MLAFFGILLLCGVILFITDFIEGFTVRHGTAIWISGFGLCAAILIGFFAIYL